MVIKVLLLVLIGFSSGVIIAGGVFAFIAIIGLVPRLAYKTKTSKYLFVFEDAIVIGGIFGSIIMIGNFRLPIGSVATSFFGFFSGIFIGCMAVSLAEVLDVIPILTRRINLKTGLSYFMLALAIGKLMGALVYFLIPGFVEYK